jgi:hypothetical protein
VSTDECKIRIDGVDKATGTGSVTSSFTSAAGCYSVEAYDADSKMSSAQTLSIVGTEGGTSSCGSLESVTDTGSGFDPTSYITHINPLKMLIGYGGNGLINGFVNNIVEPVIYSLISVILSLIIAFDLMDVLGSMLGAPGLRSTHMLKRIL